MALSIDDLLRRAVETKASDLHLKVGNHPYLRVEGVLTPLSDVPRVTPEEMLSMAFSMMTNRQKQKFKETAELDMAYGVSGLGRFRVNVFQQRGNVGMVLRVIPTKIRTSEELNLPAVIGRICEEQRGLVLVTGTTGSGKSTTLAAMIDRINADRADHLITIEDPIEFLHRDKRSFINQREVEVDTANFSTALRAALRQDPDVILVGEMRDLETISTALLAAETGHLVLSTLHTLDATETIQRIIAVFPPPLCSRVHALSGNYPPPYLDSFRSQLVGSDHFLQIFSHQFALAVLEQLLERFIAELNLMLRVQNQHRNGAIPARGCGWGK